ncbi:hypothetical protein ON010_g6003 [Phytophthora cinnamomi]|nr:hypothetical protein ON010_g6003 [Phytophthora cinnamomi]
MPHHTDVLYLIAQYLQAKGLYSSSLALQQESGLDVTWLRGSTRELALLRQWVFDGDVQRARALLLPLQSLDEVPHELQTARLALDELELLMVQTRAGITSRDKSRLARAKLKCFERLVPLFRAPVGGEESDVFKYVIMPKLQLVGLIHDAVLFHRQSGDYRAHDCISVACSVHEYDNTGEKDEGKDEPLVLDAPSDSVLLRENDHYSTEIDSVAHSVDWSRWRGRQLNSLALSMSLRKDQWIEGQERDNQSDWEVDVKEAADAAVSCELQIKETADAAVSCRPEVKDMAVNCQQNIKENAEVAVGCGTNEWSEAATQTELLNLHQFDGVHIEEKCRVTKDGEIDEEAENQVESATSISAVWEIAEGQAAFDNQLFEQERDEQTVQARRSTLAGSTSSNRRFTASWAQKSSHSLVLSTSTTSNIHQDVQLDEKGIPFEITPEEVKNTDEPQHDDLEIDRKLPVQKQTPRCYDGLTLDHVVCASVVAEVKEPQAVRALDVHPNGTHLAVGTNARALRVLDLSTPLEQRQHQLSWSSSLNLILPLLPVALERHKHHDSGLYCVSYNHHLLHSAGATSMIASGAADGSVKVLVTRDKDPLQRQQIDELWIQRGDVNGSMGKTRALEFGSPHHLWAASTTDRRLRCWDVRRTQKSSSSSPFQTLDGHVGEIQAIAMPQPLNLASANTLLLSAALDKTVRLWDTRSRRCERLVTSGAHAAFSLHFHPTDEKLVVSGHQDGGVALWDLRSTAREALQVVVPHQDECRSARWSPGGQWLLSAAFDGTLCIMQVTGSSVQPVASYHKHYGKVLQAQWHPTEPAFVSSGADKRVKLWAFAETRLAQRFRLQDVQRLAPLHTEPSLVAGGLGAFVFLLLVAVRGAAGEALGVALRTQPRVRMTPVGQADTLEVVPLRWVGARLAVARDHVAVARQVADAVELVVLARVCVLLALLGLGARRVGGLGGARVGRRLAPFARVIPAAVAVARAARVVVAVSVAGRAAGGVAVTRAVARAVGRVAPRRDGHRVVALALAAVGLALGLLGRRLRLALLLASGGALDRRPLAVTQALHEGDDRVVLLHLQRHVEVARHLRRQVLLHRVLVHLEVVELGVALQGLLLSTVEPASQRLVQA